jgi:type II secretion system protein H
MTEGNPRTCRQGRQGFNLLELVMVIAIMCIVAAIAVPRYAQAAARYRIDVAARRIVQDLTLASRQARNAGASRTVVFNAAGTQYTISNLAGLDRAAQGYRVDLLAEPYCSRVDSANFGGDRTVVFNGFGQADSGGQVVLKSGDFTRTITLDAASGKATVQ